MKLWVTMLLVALAWTGRCFGEPRWCPAEAGPDDHLLYQPIAKAAHVSGVVVGRIEFKPSGEVVRWLPLSGPLMLSQPMGKQVEHWTMRTRAQGDQLCQALVVAEFLLDGASQTTKQMPVGVVGVTIRGQNTILYTAFDSSSP